MLRVKPYSFRKDAKSVSIADAVEHDCTPDPYSYSGSVERADKAASLASEMLGKLMEVLATKGLLNKSELSDLLSGEIVEEEDKS